MAYVECTICLSDTMVHHCITIFCMFFKESILLLRADTDIKIIDITSRFKIRQKNVMKANKIAFQSTLKKAFNRQQTTCDQDALTLFFLL